ncbi:MAG: toxin-antitoxin system YwqK family antitoxin [Chitinophagia bacterium]|nr:toxin-antitoxin system YwqK family antitoxin [Chitinophagia bacterium]
MALNFPDNPSVNQIFSDATSGFYYKWNGTVWQSFSPGSSSNIQILDDFSSSFNGVTTSFSLTSNGNTITPINSQQLVINLGGVVQDPSDDYSVSGSNIIFSDAPDLGASFSGISLGPAIPISNILDGSIVPQDLSTGGPWWQSDYKVGIGTSAPTSLLDVEGDVIIAGITTINAGLAGTALVVQGNARITGILTIGTASITFNGDGMVRAKENYFNNQLEGLQRYYTNGAHLYLETYYADGKKEGTEKKYFPNGKLQEVATYSNDLRSGTTIIYYDNGNKMIENNYKAGTLDGETIVYYSNGNISEMGAYENGKENGVWKYYYTDGLLKQKGFFKVGVKSGPWLDYPHAVPSMKKQK